MKLLYGLLIICLCGVTVSAQEISKAGLLKNFKKSISKSKHQSYNEWSGYWETNNIDSVYYKSDTITLINRIGFNREYCENIKWKFYHKNKFILHKSYCCKEPCIGAVTTQENFYSVEVYKEDDNLYIEIINNTGSAKFIILGFENYETERILKLKRVTKIKG